MWKSVLTGGCACGAVRFTVRVAPKRAGLCHCMTCRKAHGSAFNPFVVFETPGVQVTGTVHGWESSPGYTRYFCPRCGSRVFAIGDGEVEITLGSFDDVGVFDPGYETWVTRREPWLPALSLPQFDENRITTVHSGT